MKCYFVGRPSPTIHWTLEGNVLTSVLEGGRANYTDNNQTMIIHDMKEQDQVLVNY